MADQQAKFWNLQDDHDLEIRGTGAVEIHCSTGETQTIKANRPIPRRGKFYFEVSIVNNGYDDNYKPVIIVGVCDKQYGAYSMLGLYQTSIGYHGDNGVIHCNSIEHQYRTQKPFKSGAHIGVLLEYGTETTLTFSKDKQEVQKIQLQPNDIKEDLYPSVGFCYAKGAIVRLVEATEIV